MGDMRELWYNEEEKEWHRDGYCEKHKSGPGGTEWSDAIADIFNEEEEKDEDYFEDEVKESDFDPTKFHVCPKCFLAQRRTILSLRKKLKEANKSNEEKRRENSQGNAALEAIRDFIRENTGEDIMELVEQEYSRRDGYHLHFNEKETGCLANIIPNLLSKACHDKANKLAANKSAERPGGSFSDGREPSG